MAQKILTTPPYPTGGGGNPNQGGGSGGGNPSAAKSVNIPASNGGVFAQKQIALYPCFNIQNNRTEYHAFDVSQGFNDPYAASEYHWRVEEMKPYRQPTIRRVIVCYRDLGQAAVTFTITGANDTGSVISSSTSIGWGSASPTMRLFVIAVDLVFTGLLPQLSVRREANAGPVSLVKVVLIGDIEENSL